MLNTHAPVSAPPRKRPPAAERVAVGPNAEAPDAGRTCSPLGVALLKPAHRLASAPLALQTTAAQPLSAALSPIVAQPSPPSVARRFVQKKGRVCVQKNAFKPLPANGSAVPQGHASKSSAPHLHAHNSCLSSKHSLLQPAQPGAQHANNGRAFQTKQCESRRQKQACAAIAVTISVGMAGETDTAANKAMARREQPTTNGQLLLVNRTTIKDAATQRTTRKHEHERGGPKRHHISFGHTEEAQQADADANGACATTTETATAAKASAAWAAESTTINLLISKKTTTTSLNAATTADPKLCDQITDVVYAYHRCKNCHRGESAGQTHQHVVERTKVTKKQTTKAAALVEVVTVSKAAAKKVAALINNMLTTIMRSLELLLTLPILVTLRQQTKVINVSQQEKKKKKKGLFLWGLLGISMAIGGTGRVAEAAFAPRSRAELMPSSGTGGVFGCVGACGQSLSVWGSYTYCSPYANGPWESGNGVCANADSDVPSGQGTGKYGAIGSWDVSAVGSLAHAFYYANNFNQPIGDWDVAKVTSLSNTFYEAYNFNQPIGDWDVAKVTSLSY
eukprot:g2443.t1